MAANIANALSPTFSAQVEKALASYGHWTLMNEINVCRQPIAGFVKKALDIMSLGKFADARKEAGGELYHLFLQIQLTDGSRKIYMQLEKNEVITITTSAREMSATDKITARLPVIDQPMTFQSLIDGTIEIMGRDGFLTYDAIDNNCQNFVLSLVQAIYQYYFNAPPSQMFIDYIYQPLKQSLDKIYAVKTIGKKLTGLAGFGRRLFGYGF